MQALWPESKLVTVQSAQWITGSRSISQWASLDGPPGYAIHTVATQGAHLEGNVIDHLMMASHTDWTTRSQAPTGPFCAPPPGTVIAIASERDAHLTAIANRVTSVHGGGVGGMGIGIDAASTGHMTLLRNRIRDVSGGSYFQYAGFTCAERNACAFGVRISGASGATINANDVSHVIGGGDVYWRECMGSISSTTIGLSLTHIGAFFRIQQYHPIRSRRTRVNLHDLVSLPNPSRHQGRRQHIAVHRW